jgi:hypothetical protein
MKACDTCRTTETPKWTAYDANGNRQGDPQRLVVDLCESCAMRWRERREEAWQNFLAARVAPPEGEGK